MLNDYLKTLQGFLRDRNQKNLNPEDLIAYVNMARREIALRTQCLRRLSPISGQIESIQVTAPGSGYSATPSVTISNPDTPSGSLPNPGGLQATAVAQVIAGGISDIAVVNGGDGYFQPVVEISDPTGLGAAAIATVSPLSVTRGQQEVYPFSMAFLSVFPGIKSIFVVNSVSFIYANFRYSLPCYPFSVYQSHIRQYPQQYQYVPTMCAQFGQGADGSIYFYPIPSTLYQMEWDCFCLPLDLSDDRSVEAIPDPWQDAVAIGAAVYAYEEMQNLNSATYYQRKFDDYVHRYSAYTRPGRVTNPYGRF